MANSKIDWPQYTGRLPLPFTRKFRPHSHAGAWERDDEKKASKRHIQSNSLDIAARSGRVEMARLLKNEKVKPMRTEKRPNALEAVYEAKNVARNRGQYK